MKLTHLLTFAAVVAASSARADFVTAEPLQVGGFFDGGGADNKIEHQNYFVGYGTVGGERTSERRSFFWYHLPDFDGEVIDVTIKLTLAFPTSLIFGLGDDPPMKDAFESFKLGATPAPGLHMVDPDLTTDEAQTIFDGMDDFAVADEVIFPLDGDYVMPMVVEIHLDDFGKSLVSALRGGEMVFTGWMPSWSHDDRTDPDTGKYLEGDELIFGLSDIPGIVPPPELTIVYEPVPEPATIIGLSVATLALLRRKKSGR